MAVNSWSRSSVGTLPDGSIRRDCWSSASDQGVGTLPDGSIRRDLPASQCYPLNDGWEPFLMARSVETRTVGPPGGGSRSVGTLPDGSIRRDQRLGGQRAGAKTSFLMARSVETVYFLDHGRRNPPPPVQEGQETLVPGQGGHRARAEVRGPPRGWPRRLPHPSMSTVWQASGAVHPDEVEQEP